MKYSKFMCVLLILGFLFNLNMSVFSASSDPDLPLSERIDLAREEIRELENEIYELLEIRRSLQHNYESINEIFGKSQEDILRGILVVGANLLMDTFMELVSNFGCTIAAKLLDDFRTGYEEASSYLVRAVRTRDASVEALALLDDHMAVLREDYDERQDRIDYLKGEIAWMLEEYLRVTGVHYDSEYRSTDPETLKAISWNTVPDYTPEEVEGYVSPEAAVYDAVSDLRALRNLSEYEKMLFEILFDSFGYTISDPEFIGANSNENVFVYESLVVPELWDGELDLLIEIYELYFASLEASQNDDNLLSSVIFYALRYREQGTFRISLRAKKNDLQDPETLYLYSGKTYPLYFNERPRIRDIMYNPSYVKRGQTALFYALTDDGDDDEIRQVSWFVTKPFTGSQSYLNEAVLDFEKLGEGTFFGWDIPVHLSEIREHINDNNRLRITAVAEDVHGGLSVFSSKDFWFRDDYEVIGSTMIDSWIEPERPDKGERADIVAYFRVRTPGQPVVHYNHYRIGQRRWDPEKEEFVSSREYVSSGSVDALLLYVDETGNASYPFVYGVSFPVFAEGFNEETREIFSNNMVEFGINNVLGGEVIGGTADLPEDSYTTPCRVVFELSEEHIGYYRQLEGDRLRGKLAGLKNNFESAIFPLEAARKRSDEMRTGSSFTDRSQSAADFAEYYVQYLKGELPADFYGPSYTVPDNAKYFMDLYLEALAVELKIFGMSTELVDETMEGTTFREDIFRRMAVIVAYRDVLKEYNNYWLRFQRSLERSGEILEDIKEVVSELEAIEQEYDVYVRELGSRLGRLPLLQEDSFTFRSFNDDMDKVEGWLDYLQVEFHDPPERIEAPDYKFADGIETDFTEDDWDGDKIDGGDDGEDGDGDDADLRFGDVTGSGNIAVSDAIAVLRQIVRLIELDAEQLMRAKVGGGDNLTVSDAILILRYIVGLIQYEDFPVHSK